MSDWCPVTTAPKDGSDFLLFDPADDDGECYKIAHWAAPVVHSGREWQAGGWLAGRTKYSEVAGNELWWMPLPLWQRPE